MKVISVWGTPGRVWGHLCLSQLRGSWHQGVGPGACSAPAGVAAPRQQCWGRPCANYLEETGVQSLLTLDTVWGWACAQVGLQVALCREVRVSPSQVPICPSQHPECPWSTLKTPSPTSRAAAYRPCGPLVPKPRGMQTVRQGGPLSAGAWPAGSATWWQSGEGWAPAAGPSGRL